MLYSLLVAAARVGAAERAFVPWPPFPLFEHVGYLAICPSHRPASSFYRPSGDSGFVCLFCITNPAHSHSDPSSASRSASMSACFFSSYPTHRLSPVGIFSLPAGRTNFAARGGRPHGKAPSAPRGRREAGAAHVAEDRGRHDDHPLWTLVSRRRTKGHPACLLVADAHLFVGVTTSFLMAFLTIHHLAL